MTEEDERQKRGCEDQGGTGPALARKGNRGAQMGRQLHGLQRWALQFRDSGGCRCGPRAADLAWEEDGKRRETVVSQPHCPAAQESQPPKLPPQYFTGTRLHSSHTGHQEGGQPNKGLGS